MIELVCAIYILVSYIVNNCDDLENSANAIESKETKSFRETFRNTSITNKGNSQDSAIMIKQITFEMKRVRTLKEKDSYFEP